MNRGKETYLRPEPWRNISLFLLTISVLTVCAFVIRPFVSAILIATMIAVVTQRPYWWLLGRIRNPNATATVTLVAVILVMVIPVFFLAQELVSQLLGLATRLQSPAMALSIAGLFVRHPRLASYLKVITDNIDIPNTAQTTAKFIGMRLASAVAHSFEAITSLVVMLFLLFFLYRDGRQAVGFVRSVLPLSDVETTILLQRTTDTIYATALGRLVVAIIQGTLSGLAFWLLGVPGALLWAVLTVVMAMIPAFGAVLVWAPIAVYLAISGHWVKAILLGVWGGGVVSLIDNILYPILVGTRIRQHTAAILISILGGVTFFGITGIILGPVLFTVSETLLEFWRVRMADGDRAG